MEPHFHVRDHNSQQKLLPKHQKMKQIAVISLITMKPTASKNINHQKSTRWYLFLWI